MENKNNKKKYSIVFSDSYLEKTHLPFSTVAEVASSKGIVDPSLVTHVK